MCTDSVPPRHRSTAAPRLQVVVAHPDDETFGCGPLLLHAAARGAATYVVCATRGESGQAPAGIDDLGAERERELRAAAEVLGVTDVEVLGFADSGMQGPTPAHSLVGARFEDVVAAVRAAVAAVRPDVLVTLDGSDGHRDHARIRDATLQVAAELDVSQVYLQCLPRSLMAEWFAHAREVGGREHVEVATATESVPGTPDEEITTHLPAAEHLAVLEQAMSRHASQQSPFDGIAPDLRRRFLDVAYLRRVHPAWHGGALEQRLSLPGAS